MYRQSSYDALTRALQQYFDLMEPILPPPHGRNYIESGNEVSIFRYPSNDEVATTIHHPTTIEVLLPFSQFHTFFTEDDPSLFDDQYRNVPQTQTHYHVQVAQDGPQPTPDDDLIFLRPPPKRLYNANRRPPGIPARGIRQ